MATKVIVASGGSIKMEANVANEPIASGLAKPTTLKLQERQALLDIIFADHIYAKPYSLHPDANRVAPAKVLQFSRKKPVPNKVKDALGEGEVDVVAYKPTGQSIVSYDSGKSRNMMSEMEKLVDGLASEGEVNEEDEQFVRVGWTKPQEGLFDKVYHILLTYSLARKAYHLNPNEPVLRRLALDKATSRVRQAFSRLLWDTKLTAWLHGVLVDGLSTSLFLGYLEVMQTLKAKVPSLMESILNNAAYVSARKDVMVSTSLSASLRKAWDPSVGLSTRLRQLKFPQPPFFIMIPCGPNLSTSSSKRARFWHTQLSTFGKVIPVNMHTTGSRSDVDTKHYLEHLIAVVRSKVAEFRTLFSERPVVLIGWSIGALVACMIAGLEKIAALVCLAYPCIGTDDERTVESANLDKVTCPTMFVIGSHDRSTSVARLEEMRKEVKANNRLLVVPSADSMLKLASAAKKRLQMTQSMVDRLIQDEINLFLMNTFSPEPAPRSDMQTGRSSPSPGRLVVEKKNKKKRAASPGTDGKGDEQVVKRKKKIINADGSTTPAKKPSPTSNAPTKPAADSSLSLASLLKIPPTTKATTSKPACGNSSGAPAVTKSTASTSSHKISAKRPASKQPGDRTGKKPRLSMKKSSAVSSSSVVMTRSYGTASFVTTSQPGMITLQGLSSGGSILLSSGGGPVRLRQGSNVLYVPSSSGVPSTGFRALPALNGAAPGLVSSGVPPSQTSASTVFSYQLTGPSSSLPSALSGGNQQRTAMMTLNHSPATATSGASTQTRVNSAVSSAGVRVGLTPTPVVQSPTVVPGSRSPVTTTTITTHLSHADLQYLASLLTKQQQQQQQQHVVISNHPSSSQATTPKVSCLPVSMQKTSPVALSTKISIGTLTNLSSASPMLDPSRGNSSVGPASDAVKLHPKHTVVSSLPRQTTDAKTTTTAPLMTVSSSKSQSTGPGVQHIPVTLTIPLSSLTGGLSLANNQRTLTLSQSSALSALLAQQKLILSTGRSTASNAQRQTVYTVASSSSSGLATTSLHQSAASLAVSSALNSANAARQMSRTDHKLATPATLSMATAAVASSNGATASQVTAVNQPRAPAAITLRFPNPNAVVHDQKLNSSKFGSEIKLIGLVNRSTTSTSQLNLTSLRQSQSAPVSPATVTPSVLSSGRSTPGTPPTPNETKPTPVHKVATSDTTQQRTNEPPPPTPTKSVDPVNLPIQEDLISKSLSNQECLKNIRRPFSKSNHDTRPESLAAPNRKEE